MLRRAKQNGFTLVELLVVLAMFAVLASFAVPSYQNMIESAKIKTATDSILTGLQVARAEAVKRNTDVQFDFRGVNVSDWTVCLAPAGGGACPAVDDATTIQSRKSGEGSSANVTVTASDAGPYIFNGFGVMESPAAALTIDIDNAALADARNLRILIGAGGATRSCDPALDTGGTDPRRC